MSDSLITKKAIASGMKELTRKKSFDKITVSDITKACGLNRQTFYYHFQDKFELVDWIYYNETISIIYQLNYDNWDAKVLEMLTKIKAEDYFYMNTLKASVGNEFREYLFRVTMEFFCDLIGKVAENTNMGEEEIRFIAEFYAFGIVGVIISWAQKGMKETPEYITEQLKNLVNGTERFASVRYQMRNLNDKN